MQETPPSTRTVRGIDGYGFGPFLVDPVRRLLWRDGKVVTLTGKTFDLLLILLRHRDRIVDKNELLTLIWGDTAVQENNLVRQMSNLRRALLQRPDQHDYVVTVSGRGYRFVGPVTEIEQLSEDLPLSAIDDRPEARSPEAEATNGISHQPPIRPGWAVTISPRGIASAAVVLVLIGLLLFWQRGPAESHRTLRQLTYDAGLQLDPTWAPDGQRLAYASDRDGNSDIWIQSTADPTPIKLTTSTSADWQPDWSPDGTMIVFRSERDGGGLYVITVKDGQERRIAAFGFRPQWSPDGSRVLFTDVEAQGPKQTLYVVSLDQAAPRPVRADLTDKLRSVTGGWRSDGRVSLLSRDRSRWTFVTAGIESGAPVESTISPEVASRLAGVVPGQFRWARSGRFLFFEGRAQDASNLWRVSIDPATLNWTAIEQLTLATGRNGTMALSADGSTVAFSSLVEQTRLWSFPFSATTVRLTGAGTPVTPGGAGEYDASAPPDGTRLAYRTVRTGRQELWEHSIDSGRDRLLLVSSDALSSPRWSRDGTRLAYLRGGNGQSDGVVPRAVAILPTSGGLEKTFKMKPGKDSIVPDDWSANGSLILGACRVGGMDRQSVCTMDLTRPGEIADLVILATDQERDLISPRFSPDQRWISFMAVARGRSNISTLFVMPAEGGEWVPLTDARAYDDKPRWSPDGRALLFVSDRGGLLNLWARPFDPVAGRPTGEAVRLTNFTELNRRLSPSLGRMEIAVSNDRVFLPITETAGRIWTLDHVDR